MKYDIAPENKNAAENGFIIHLQPNIDTEYKLSCGN